MSKEQWEEEAIQRFIPYLESKYSVSYDISGRDVLVPSGQNFDYELTDTSGGKCAVELFRLVESEEDLGQGRAWGQVTEKLKEEIKSRNLKGFLINTPLFCYQKKDIEAFVSQQADIIENAIKGNGHNKEFEIGGYEFNRMSDLDTVVFSFSRGVRSIDPPGTALEGLARLLPTKNGQLDIAAHRRILFIVNWAIFVDSDHIINALTKINPEELKNVDQIYYEAKPSEFDLVFDKRVFEAIKEKSLIVGETQNKILNLTIRYMMADKRPEAFEYVKAVTENYGGIGWLSDRWTRESIVIYADNKLKEQESLDEAIWVVERFNNDENPNKDGSNDADDTEGKYNYHTKALDGEDISTITTVRGHLCWLMSGIIVQNKPEFYTPVIKIIERYLKEDNLYIRSEVMFPLLELVRRTRAVKNQDGSLFSWDKKERLKVREIAFGALRNNAKYPRVMYHVLHLFGYLRDINEQEAEEAISLFLKLNQDYIMRDLAALIVYFALFRHNDWKEGFAFNPKVFIETLKEKITSGDEHLRGSIAWHLWKVLDEKNLLYSDIRVYLLLFSESPYNYHVSSMLALSIEKIIKLAPEDAILLYRNEVRKIKEYLDVDNLHRHHFLNSTEEVLPLLVSSPDDLLEVISDLRILWQKGVHIGDPKIIFEIYRNVIGEKREVIKKSLRSFWGEMKAQFPTLVHIDWTT